MKTFKLWHKASMLVFALLSIELGIIITIAHLLQRAEYELWQESHARNVTGQANSLVKHFYDAGAALAAYGVTRNKQSEMLYQNSSDKIHTRIMTLSLLVDEEPNSGKPSISQVETFGYRALSILERFKRTLDSEKSPLGVLKTVEIRDELSRSITQFFSLMESFTERQRRMEEMRRGLDASLRLQVRQWLVVAVVFNILVAALLTQLFVRGIARRMDIVVENTTRLAANMDLHEPVKGSDEIAHLDRMFHDMAVALRRAEGLKTQFVALITHELRTPIGAISLTLQLLELGNYGALDDKGRKRVRNAERSCARLIGMINELLDAEKIAAGKLQLSFTSCRIDTVIEKAVEISKVLAEKKSISIEYSSTPLESYVDENRIEQVLLNLISNAIKHAPEGGVVRISSAQSSEWIEVSVEDNGPGIPADFRGKIFAMYEQAGQPAIGGTGLGLAISKAIIEGHGGTIGVLSEPDSPTRFWFKLPK